MRNSLAIKMKRFSKKFFTQLNPLSNAARLILASKFSEDDKDQGHRQGVADAFRFTMVVERNEAIIEAADIKEKRVIWIGNIEQIVLECAK